MKRELEHFDCSSNCAHKEFWSVSKLLRMLEANLEPTVAKLVFVIFQIFAWLSHSKSILAYNGGAVVAMKGQDCVAIASDKRYGIQAQTVATNFPKLKENRIMKPKTFAAMLSNLLYEKRFGPYFVEPVIAGLDPYTHQPYVCNMDLIGCPNEPEDFVVSGTCSEQLYGMCEALWEPNLKPDELFETISQ
ncbi:Proteasome subunit beta type, partial [Operophtera brumata]